MLLTKAFARRILAISPLVAGAAFLALAAFTPSIASATTLTIFHDSAPPFAGTDPSVNPFNSSHTVVGQLSGVCAEVDPSEIDSDGEGNSCLSDGDCADADEFCDFSGVSGVGVAFRITGTNAQDIDFSPTNGSGQVSTTYADANGPGIDTIQGCADLGEGGIDDDVSACLTDFEPDEDIPSNTLSKDWVPTVVLSPPGAFNPIGGSHTVTATLNGVTGVCTGLTPTVCTSDAACSAGNTCDFSGYLLGIKVTSGPNAGPGADTGLVATNSKGQVTLTYSDTLAGTDTIQACADLFFDGDFDLDACLSDAAAGGGDGPFDDVASNTSRKVWGAQVATLTPAVAFNPIGVQHQLTTTLTSGFANICSDGSKTCTTSADCTLPATCGQAGYPVFFAVVGTCTGGNNGGATCTSNSDCNSNVCSGGPNLGELGSSNTNSGGVATKSYTSAVEGQDKIQACVDADIADGALPDDVSFIQCLNDSGSELEVPTNTVIKNWFANFVTGGGGVNVGSGLKKKNLQNSGIVGKAGLAGIQGDWQAVSQIAGKTVACHFNTFTSISFSGGPATSPPSTHSVATFTTGPGKCNDGSNTSLTVTITDLGEGKKVPRDTISVTSNNPSFATGGTLPLVTGNYQVHSITP
jgi:hypothetical protein